MIHIIGAPNYCNRTKLFARWKAAKNKRNNPQADLKESYTYVRMLKNVQDNPVLTQERENSPNFTQVEIGWNSYKQEEN